MTLFGKRVIIADEFPKTWRWSRDFILLTPDEAEQSMFEAANGGEPGGGTGTIDDILRERVAA